MAKRSATDVMLSSLPNSAREFLAALRTLCRDTNGENDNLAIWLDADQLRGVLMIRIDMYLPDPEQSQPDDLNRDG